MNSVPHPPSSAATGSGRDGDLRLPQHQRLETLGLLASGVAHDFNNLLTAIVGHAAVAETLLPAGHPARAEITRIQANASRAAALARRMLTFGRPGQADPAPVDLVSLIEEALPLLRSSLPRRVELRPRFTIARGLVRADANQLQQLFFNLGIGAGQSIAGQDGSIEITIERVTSGPPPAVQIGQLGPGPHLCLSVSDTGRRGAAAPRPRGSGAESADEPGRAIVQSIVQQLEGGLAVQSTTSEGTTVRVYLPEAAPPPATPPLTFERASPPATAAHIAIVDDEETVVRLAKQALEFSGYRTTAAASPEVCLERVAQEPNAFDLIITDQRMPTMSGIDMVRALRAMGNRTPVLITSGSLAAVTAHELQVVGLARFIGKPFTLVDLLSAVQELIERARISTPPSSTPGSDAGGASCSATPKPWRRRDLETLI